MNSKKVLNKTYQMQDGKEEQLFLFWIRNWKFGYGIILHMSKQRWGGQEENPISELGYYKMVF